MPDSAPDAVGECTVSIWRTGDGDKILKRKLAVTRCNGILLGDTFMVCKRSLNVRNEQVFEK